MVRLRDDECMTAGREKRPTASRFKQHDTRLGREMLVASPRRASRGGQKGPRDWRMGRLRVISTSTAPDMAKV